MIPAHNLIEPTGWGGLYLVCPACGDNYTHVQGVALLDRDGSGGPVKVRTLWVGRQPRAVVPEPELSAERDTLVIFVWCEACDETSAIALAQHEGNTRVDVTHAPENRYGVDWLKEADRDHA